MLGEADLQIDSTIVTSTIFKLGVPGEYSERYHYSRYSNPTRDSLESALASLDNADYAVTYSSKVAGSLAVISTLKTNDHVIFSDNLNCQKLKSLNGRFEAEIIDFGDLENLRKSIKENTKLVWIESLVTIPWIKQLDVKAIAEIVHEKSEALLVVDNTFLTPHFLRPLTIGADLVIYSLNEFIAGHGDILMGAVLTNIAEVYEKLKQHQYSGGAVPSPFDCFMVKRSLKTLSLRMDRHYENCCSVVKFLSNHSKVEKVFTSKCFLDQTKKSAILSMQIKGSFADSKNFLSSLKSIAVSEFLGSCDSTVTFPWTMSHSQLSESERIAAGVKDNLFIFSVGIEDSHEIISDLDQALANV